MTVAYGFIPLQSLFNQRINVVGVERVYSAVEESAAEYNRYVTGLLAQFAQKTTDAKWQFELPSGGTLQPLDENGNPIPTEPTGSYDVAVPIDGAGDAWGGNRVSVAQMSVEEVNRRTTEMMNKDKDWIARHMIAAILTKDSWTYNDKSNKNGYKGLGNITVQPLANGDAVTYVRRNTGVAAVDNHYLAQANAIDDSNNPFPTIRAELVEHPSNGGYESEVIVYVSSSLVTSIKGLATFVDRMDSHVIDSADTDRLAMQPTPAFGDLIGYVDRCWIVEWPSLPAGYMIAHATGGGAVLGMREYPEEELQGFFPERIIVDGNLRGGRMIRYAGFGVINRVGALAYYVGNGTYPNPAAFTAPLKV